MSNIETCWNCNTQFHPHGAQKFCSARCRILYNKAMRPVGKREMRRIKFALAYRKTWIENAPEDDVKFDFHLCYDCWNVFAVRVNKIIATNVKCPFCQSDKRTTSLNDKYKVVPK